LRANFSPPDMQNETGSQTNRAGATFSAAKKCLPAGLIRRNFTSVYFFNQYIR